MANLLPTIALSHPFKRSVMKSRTRPVNLDVCMKLTLNPHSQNRRCGTQKRLRIYPLCHLLGFGSRMAIRSSERRRAEEKNSRVTLVLEVSSKPGPLQKAKRPAPYVHFPASSMPHPPTALHSRWSAHVAEARHPPLRKRLIPTRPINRLVVHHGPNSSLPHRTTVREFHAFVHVVVDLFGDPRRVFVRQGR